MLNIWWMAQHFKQKACISNRSIIFYSILFIHERVSARLVDSKEEDATWRYGRYFYF